MRLSDIYFENKGQFPVGGLNEEQHKVYKEQEKKYYNNVDLQIACGDDKTLLIESFIDSENVALTYQFQGQLYPMVHYRIDKLLKSSFRGVPEEKIVHFFFHCIRLGKLFLPNEKLFPLYKKALLEALLLMDENNYLVCNIQKESMYLLFGVMHSEHTDAVINTSYADYKKMLGFITMCNQYTSYPSLRKKKKRFIPFTEDAFVMTRTRDSFTRYFTLTSENFNSFSFTMAGTMVLFLTAMDTESKALLFELHTQDLNRKQVWLLGSFYKDFTTTDTHKLLLNDLCNIFPDDWVNEV